MPKPKTLWETGSGSSPGPWQRERRGDAEDAKERRGDRGGAAPGKMPWGGVAVNGCSITPASG